MNETVEFLGITFRSWSHVYRFIMSMTFLLTSLLLLACASRFLFFVSCGCVGMHLSTTVTASLATGFGHRNGPVYSVDCMWFNAALAVIHWGLFSIGWRWAKRYEDERRRRKLESEAP